MEARRARGHCAVCPLVWAADQKADKECSIAIMLLVSLLHAEFVVIV